MRRCVVEKYNEFLKLRMNFDLFTNKNEISRSLSLLNQNLIQLKIRMFYLIEKRHFQEKHLN